MLVPLLRGVFASAIAPPGMQRSAGASMAVPPLEGHCAYDGTAAHTRSHHYFLILGKHPGNLHC